MSINMTISIITDQISNNTNDVKIFRMISKFFRNGLEFRGVLRPSYLDTDFSCYFHTSEYSSS